MASPVRLPIQPSRPRPNAPVGEFVRLRLDRTDFIQVAPGLALSESFTRWLSRYTVPFELWGLFIQLRRPRSNIIRVPLFHPYLAMLAKATDTVHASDKQIEQAFDFLVKCGAIKRARGENRWRLCDHQVRLEKTGSPGSKRAA